MLLKVIGVRMFIDKNLGYMQDLDCYFGRQPKIKELQETVLPQLKSRRSIRGALDASITMLWRNW
jgi:hypothetical protein